MQRKYIWMFCLTIGLTLVGVKSCGRTLTDWVITIDFVFVNQTNHLLEFKVWADYENGVRLPHRDVTIIIPPLSTSNVFSYSTMGEEKIDAERERYAAVMNILKPSGISHWVFSMLIDNITCAVFDGVGFALPSNYEYEVLGNRHIKYIYTFTDADFENLVECDE